MTSTIRRPETDYDHETYGTRFYDDPLLSEVFYPRLAGRLSDTGEPDEEQHAELVRYDAQMADAWLAQAAREYDVTSEVE